MYFQPIILIFVKPSDILLSIAELKVALVKPCKIWVAITSSNRCLDRIYVFTVGVTDGLNHTIREKGNLVKDINPLDLTIVKRDKWSASNSMVFIYTKILVNFCISQPLCLSLYRRGGLWVTSR